VAVAAERHGVVVADRGVPGQVQAGAAHLADRGGQEALQMRETELLVAVADGGVGLPVLLEAAVLDALVVPRVAGVGGDPPAAHDLQEPLQLGLGVVVRVVAGGHREVQRGAGDGRAAQRVDPLDQRDRAVHGQRLVRAPGVPVGGAQVLQAHRVLGVDQVQVGELHERGERGTASGAARRRRGQVAAHDARPARPVAEAAVAGTGAGGGDAREGGAPGVRGEGRGRGLAGLRHHPGGPRVRGDGLAVGGPQGVADARGDGRRAGGGEDGTAVDRRDAGGDRAYARHGAVSPSAKRVGRIAGGRCREHPAHSGCLAPGMTCA
jgi:hypothetical protein